MGQQTLQFLNEYRDSSLISPPSVFDHTAIDRFLSRLLAARVLFTKVVFAREIMGPAQVLLPDWVVVIIINNQI